MDVFRFLRLQLRSEAEEYTATRTLGAKARKAAQLAAHQTDIDREVSRQWGDAYGSAATWAGQVTSPAWPLKCRR